MAKEKGDLRASDLKRRANKEVVQERTQFDDRGKTGVASSVTSFIRTADALLKYTKVDMSLWEIERQQVNKWEGFCVPRTTRKNGEDEWVRPSTEPVLVELFQVKVWLRRKSSLHRGLDELIATVAKHAPGRPLAKSRRARSMRGARRCLEVSVMDPHLGLLCQRPESDGEWDLDIAAGTMLAAIDDLVAKAEAFGPFEEVVMPFGNDYVHADNVDHTTTAGTPQPEMIPWHRVFAYAERVAIEQVARLRRVAPKVHVYQVPGNHSRHSDFVMGRVLRAWYRNDPGVVVDAGASPFKFHRYGVNLIGFEHGHSIKGLRFVGLMANSRPQDWAATKYREWHLGDQHRKGTAKPSSFEEQGVAIEYLPSLVVANEWHKLKAFNHQQRSAMAFVWDRDAGPIGRFSVNIFDQKFDG